jgi:hypothetical protein
MMLTFLGIVVIRDLTMKEGKQIADFEELSLAPGFEINVGSFGDCRSGRVILLKC